MRVQSDFIGPFRDRTIAGPPGPEKFETETARASKRVKLVMANGVAPETNERKKDYDDYPAAGVTGGHELDFLQQLVAEIRHRQWMT